MNKQLVTYEWLGDCETRTHSGCHCDLKVKVALEGVAPTYFVIKRDQGGRWLSFEDCVYQMFARLESNYELVGNAVVPCSRNMEETLMAMRLEAAPNCEIMNPYMPVSHIPTETVLCPPRPIVVAGLKYADQQFVKHFAGVEFGPELWRDVWQNPWYVRTPEPVKKEVPSLKVLALRALAMHNSVLGTTNGRPHVISAMSNIYPLKYTNACAQSIGATKQVTPKMAEVLEFMPQALDLMYSAMGTKENFGTIKAKVDLKLLQDMFLGSSGGLNRCYNRIIMHEGHRVVVSAVGKKAEVFEPSLDAIKEFLTAIEDEDGEYPDTVESPYANAPKNENLFSWDKQQDDQKYEEWLAKVRMFTIPPCFFIMMERMVSTVRMLMERGKVIQIGHKWSRGGADRIAHLLGIKKGEFWKVILGDGDIKGFDFGVHSVFIEAYLAMALVYYKQGGEEYELLKRILRYVITRLVQRIVHMFGQVWIKIVGGVPSGCFNTSHLDSWVMALYWFLFVTWQINFTPDGPIKEKLERMAVELLLIIITYGDDQVTSVPRDPDAAKIFSMSKFKEWLKAYFGVILQKEHNDVKFITETRSGYGIDQDSTLTFLRHKFVRNPHFQEGGTQPRFLPFRDMREYIIRMVWGRETKVRTEFDCLLSCVGHAYGTYGSNPYALYFLKQFYKYVLYHTGLSEREVLNRAREQMTNTDLKKMRQYDITVEQLLRGLPTMAELVKKNTYDEGYHLIRQEKFYPEDE